MEDKPEWTAGGNQIETDELQDWLQEIDSDPTHHHFVEVVQLPAPGHGSQIVNLVAVCTCGWRSGEHQLYLGASTTWAEERARHQLENAVRLQEDEITGDFTAVYCQKCSKPWEVTFRKVGVDWMALWWPA